MLRRCTTSVEPVKISRREVLGQALVSKWVVEVDDVARDRCSQFDMGCPRLPVEPLYPAMPESSIGSLSRCFWNTLIRYRPRMHAPSKDRALGSRGVHLATAATSQLPRPDGVAAIPMMSFTCTPRPGSEPKTGAFPIEFSGTTGPDDWTPGWTPDGHAEGKPKGAHGPERDDNQRQG